MGSTGVDALEHAKVASWFLGPKAENFDLFCELLQNVVLRNQQARQQVYPGDAALITPEMQTNEVYSTSTNLLRKNVKFIAELLARNAVPTWSPRYNAHMTTEPCMPGMIGYITGMMYNPNNVASEASPLATMIEYVVGQDLCKMLGYNLDGPSAAWGHITCGGSVANLESMWASRNLKFYPLSLTLAMKPGKELAFLAEADPPFMIQTCSGQEKEFKSLSTWELLNLKPSHVLDISTRLGLEYGISSTYLQSALKPYLVQTVGLHALEKRFNIKSPKFFLSTTKHYSHPKGGAIIGVGSESFVDITVDVDARLDVEDLKRHLDTCLEHGTAVFGVTAIIGSTEHGACDPLDVVVKIRSDYEKRGLSFAIHADGAWGGYFRTMMIQSHDKTLLPVVSELPLKHYTQRQLAALQHADTITVDPHKSGYLNYPAGSLCYKDGRMRFLNTWTSPIVSHTGDEPLSMGLFGVEGSKPGASPIAVWLAHHTLGLTQKGYGKLLGEAVYSCTKFYCHWATMTTEDSDLVVVPLNMLPTERKGRSEAEIEKQKEEIRAILNTESGDLTDEQRRLLGKLGGDLMINAFACNFKIDGRVNTYLSEANYLNARLFKRMSVTSTKDDAAKTPFYLTETTLDQHTYGKCLESFKRRLHLVHPHGPAVGNLGCLVNVTMSPWPKTNAFMKGLVDDFKRVAAEEVKHCILRNKITPDHHCFIMQGRERIFLVKLPMFNMANHRHQLIVTGHIPPSVKEQYQALRKEKPSAVFTLTNTEKAHVHDLLKPHASFEVRLDEGVYAADKSPLATFTLTSIHVIIFKSLSPDSLQSEYPDKMPFHLYGSGSEVHIDHILETSPNALLASDCVAIHTHPHLTQEQIRSGSLIAEFQHVYERSLQPLPTDKQGQLIAKVPGLAFVPGSDFKVEIFDNHTRQHVATGTITLGASVFADWREINRDPAEELVMKKADELTLDDIQLHSADY
ncbi:hypothetical protein CDD82_3195 [Ophiocordyceps australis]|uniref:Uncharacterized protein n=1 Tax=Ophiocordyceps australis TaxID=1399860 RepID=A0A2C5ZEH3_9HYPO|nr:hypothetical protein CDD82_3195 [Ophiocordyceps australis]